MDTFKLRVFVTLAKTESIRKAADILNLTPSAISKIYRQLEEEIGTTLLTPLGRGLTLTSAGRQFAVHAERVVGEMDNLKNSFRTQAATRDESPLKIATFEVFSTHFLHAFTGDHLLNRKLMLYEALPGELEHSVMQEKVDFGITYMPVPFHGVEHMKITRIEMGTFRKRGLFSGLKLEELPYVVPVLPLSGIPTRHEGLDGWPANSFSRKVVHEVTLMESALELCRQGLCAGYFPAFVIQLHNRRYKTEHALVRHAIPAPGEACFTDVYLVKRKNMQENQDVKLVAKLLRTGTKIPAGFAG